MVFNVKQLTKEYKFKKKVKFGKNSTALLRHEHSSVKCMKKT